MSHYDILGVATDATFAEIKAAYKRFVRQTHSDRTGDDEMMRLVVVAYQVLSDPNKRAAYDAAQAQAQQQQRQRQQQRPTLREQLGALRQQGAVIVDDAGEALDQLDQAVRSLGRVVVRVRRLWRSWRVR